MTQAEKIADGKGKPTPQVEAAMESVQASAQAVHDSIEEALLSRTLVRQHREASNGEMSVEEAEKAAAATAADWKENGTYAYSFQELEDGSCLAVYVEQAGGEVKFKAFESLAHTRFFHPVKNISGEE